MLLVGARVLRGAVLNPERFVFEIICNRLRHGLSAIPVRILRWRIEWIVRSDEAHEEMPREVAVDLFEPLLGASADPHVLKRFGR